MDQPGKADLPVPVLRFYFRTRKLLAILGFLLLQSGAGIQADSLLVKAWKTGDETSIYAYGNIPSVDNYLALTDSDIAEIAEPMARWIPIKNYLESSSDQSWKKFKTEQDWTPFLNALPRSNEIKKRWWLGLLAAWELRSLAEKGRIKNQAVIPYLIEGLDHPCNSYTARDCYYALASLTRLYDTRQPVYQQ